MAQIVAGFACSHVPFMVLPKNWERLEETERVNLRTAFDRARGQLEVARPDVLITFADDHFDRCFYDNLPAFLVGRRAGARPRSRGFWAAAGIAANRERPRTFYRD
jgi:hypothetical protein